MNPHKVWYATKRGKTRRAYQAALEMEEMSEAERLFKEYERYAKLAKGGE